MDLNIFIQMRIKICKLTEIIIYHHLPSSFVKIRLDFEIWNTRFYHTMHYWFRFQNLEVYLSYSEVLMTEAKNRHYFIIVNSY